jgi:hypothetical protein
MWDDVARLHESEQEKLVRRNQDHSCQEEVRRSISTPFPKKTHGQKQSLTCSQEHENFDEVKTGVKHGGVSLCKYSVTAYPLQRQFCDSAYHLRKPKHITFLKTGESMKPLQPSRATVYLLIFGLLAACAPPASPVPTATPTPYPTPTLQPQALEDALFEAVRTDDMDAAAALLAAGADINAEGDFNLTPMDIASARENSAMVRLLLEAGASWEIEAFHKAIVDGDLETVEMFLDAGADLHERSGQWGFHALLFAAQYGHTEIGELLIERGADVYMGDNYGDCALNVASWFGQLEFVTMLLDRGVNVNTPNNQGKTALIHSIDQKHADVEAALRAAGATE